MTSTDTCRILELRILPPFAIARVGSGSTPLENFTLEGLPPPDFVIGPDGRVSPAGDPTPPLTPDPLGFRRIVPQPTFIIDEETGAIVSDATPPAITWKEKDGHTEGIRPVAPFLEVWARTGDGKWEPLTLALLAAHGLGPEHLRWSIHVANRKVARRTGNDDDAVTARVGPFSDHGAHRLRGSCPNFLGPDKSIDFGSVRYLRPTDRFPGIRLRFTPAAGRIYGPPLVGAMKEACDADPNLFRLPESQVVYDPDKGWMGFESDKERPGAPAATGVELEHLTARETLPPSLYAIVPPAPCWLNDNVAVSRGYFDDTCDGRVEVELALPGRPALAAAARICSGPPAVVPDTIFIRTLADDLDQVIFGPDVPPDESPAHVRERAIELLRRAFDAVRFLNVAVMNGNPVRGRDPLIFDTMPAEEAFDVQRQMRPVVPTHTADTLAVLALHQHVYAALCAGAAPWFAHALRLPTEVGDYTDHGRRKMPAMMCGADGSYLALTWRQINAVLQASGVAPRPSALAPTDQPALPPAPGAAHSPTAGAAPSATGAVAADAKPSDPAHARLVARNRSAQLHHVAAGNPLPTRPVTSIGNCTPGLEVDFRAVWRRVFEGILLRDWDNLVMAMEPRDDGTNLPLPVVDGTRLTSLAGHRLLRVEQDNLYVQMTGPSPADGYTRSVVLATAGNPFGLAPLEWSNALARILHQNTGAEVRCWFTRAPVWSQQVPWTGGDDALLLRLRVRPFFEDGTAVISGVLAKPGELTQGLCSPWQNDYRECSCYYWASARPDFVNVVPTSTGASAGDNWMQKRRTGEYVPDDYVDSRLLYYDDLFKAWETHLRFQIGGRDAPDQTRLPESRS